jgi:hypothetical protein
MDTKMAGYGSVSPLDVFMGDGWGFLVYRGGDVMWVYIYRDTPAGREVLPINVCAVLPAECGEGQPAWEIQHGDESLVIVPADLPTEGNRLPKVYLDMLATNPISAKFYPGANSKKEE